MGLGRTRGRSRHWCDVVLSWVSVGQSRTFWAAVLLPQSRCDGMRREEGPSRALGGVASQPAGLAPEMGLGFIRTERGLWAPEVLAHSGRREKQKPERQKGFASWLQPQEGPGPGGQVPWSGLAPVGAPGLFMLLGAPGDALLLEACSLILPAYRVPAEQGQRECVCICVCVRVCSLPTAYGLEHLDSELLMARPSHRGRTGYEDSGARRPGLKQLCGGVVPPFPAPVSLWGRLSPGSSRLQQPQSGGREGAGSRGHPHSRTTEASLRTPESQGAWGSPHHLPVQTGVRSLECPLPGGLRPARRAI